VATVAVINSTITKNVANSDQDDSGNGGGIVRGEDFNDPITLKNTIIAGNEDHTIAAVNNGQTSEVSETSEVFRAERGNPKKWHKQIATRVSL